MLKGFTEALCENGHLRIFDCWNDEGVYEGTEKCNCGAKFIFMHQVDQTNDEGVRYPFEITEPEVRETCNLGHSHVVKETIYKIPRKE